MKINNVDISTYKAKLMNYNISNASFEINNMWSNNTLSPFIYDKVSYKYKTLELKLDLLCKDLTELEKMKSKLIKDITISSIDLENSFIYTGFVTGTPSYEFIKEGNEIATITMLVLAEREEIKVTFNKKKNGTFNNKGTAESPCIITITPTIGIVDLNFKINNNNIKIHAIGLNEVVTISEKTITVNGANKFNDVDIWEFPHIVPGTNVIELDSQDCVVEIKYKPRFL